MLLPACRAAGQRGAGHRLGLQMPRHILAQPGPVWAPCRCPPAHREPSPQVPAALSAEELARKQKALARAALAGRSFSSPHGELDARRLCRALEKVSQKRNQSLEGRLDQLGPKTPRLQHSVGESSEWWLWGQGVALVSCRAAVPSPCPVPLR